MPAYFVLKRYLEGFEEYGDLYEAIKSGRKKVEYRNATDHWKIRLLTPKAVEILESDERDINLVFREDLLKHHKAVFVVGYTKFPKLVTDITKIVYLPDSNQFETHLTNVRENPCKFTELECTKEEDCNNCIIFLYGYYKAKESLNGTKNRVRTKSILCVEDEK